MNSRGMDAAFIERMYLEYKDKVAGYLAKRIAPEDREDILSEIFLKAADHIAAFDEAKASFSTWLYSIAHNTVCNYYRDKKQLLSLDGKALGQRAEEGESRAAGDLFDEVEAALQKEALAEALECLKERERDMVVLFYYYNMSLSEIAAKLKVSYSNAKFIRHSAVKKLRGILEKDTRITG